MNSLAQTRGSSPGLVSKLALPEPWEGKIELGFMRQGPRTVIEQRTHSGPLMVQQPFYPEADVCHVYLLHPPGGLVGGDRLTVNVAAKMRSHALITTPAASKFYRSAGKPATQTQRLAVGDHACIEWLPQETIFFAGCHALLDTRIELASTARFLNWEILCFGRMAAGESFDSGTVEQRLEIWRDGKPSVIERLALSGGDRLQSESWGLAGHAAMGTLTAGPADAGLASHVQALAISDSSCAFGATLLDDVLVVRCLAAYSDTVRSILTRVWTEVRPTIAKRTAHEPRIWRT